MAKKPYGADKGDLLGRGGEGPSDAAAHADALFGAAPLPESGTIRVKPQPLSKIWPDARQPRRAIPLAVRGEFTGSPDEIPAVLARWHAVAQERLGRPIEAVEYVMRSERVAAEDEASEITDPVVAEYLALLGLAGDILAEGLTNPITVFADGPRYVVETGERRLLAHHLLTVYADAEKFGRIPARVMDKPSVWRQASENANRRPLNAIGMARQLALLLMDCYPNEDFGAFDDVVMPGESDRAFYAQVANGNAYRIPRGMSQQILEATGLKSKVQLRQYRALLNLPDDLWVRADMENWTENACRTYMQGEKEQDTVTTVTVSPSLPRPADSGVYGFPPGKNDDTGGYEAPAWTPPAAPSTPPADIGGGGRVTDSPLRTERPDTSDGIKLGPKRGPFYELAREYRGPVIGEDGLLYIPDIWHPDPDEPPISDEELAEMWQQAIDAAAARAVVAEQKAAEAAAFDYLPDTPIVTDARAKWLIEMLVQIIRANPKSKHYDKQLQDCMNYVRVSQRELARVFVKYPTWPDEMAASLTWLFGPGMELVTDAHQTGPTLAALKSALATVRGLAPDENVD